MLVCGLLANAQTLDTSKLKLNLLRAPSSPAANLLGFAVSDIEKPSDVSDFMFTLQSATGTNSLFPSNYAVDLAPFWIFRSGALTTDRFSSKNFSDVFKQSFVVSTAIRNADTSSADYDARNLYQSMGIKFSIIRGSLSKKTTTLLESIHELQSEIASGINLAISEKLESDSIYQSLKRARQVKLAEKMDPDHAEVVAISQKMEKRLEKIMHT